MGLFFFAECCRFYCYIQALNGSNFDPERFHEPMGFYQLLWRCGICSCKIWKWCIFLSLSLHHIYSIMIYIYMYIYIYMGSVRFPGPKGFMIRVGYHHCLFTWKTSVCGVSWYDVSCVCFTIRLLVSICFHITDASTQHVYKHTFVYKHLVLDKNQKQTKMSELVCRILFFWFIEICQITEGIC